MNPSTHHELPERQVAPPHTIIPRRRAHGGVIIVPGEWLVVAMSVAVVLVGALWIGASPVFGEADDGSAAAARWRASSGLL
jgi:hypothetical protein